MGSTSNTVEITDLHRAHPRIRAKDWRSPLVRRLLKNGHYHDGDCQFGDSFRASQGATPAEQTLGLSWSGLKEDFDQAIQTYQEPVITEFATLGLACILVARRTGLEITEVARRGEKADYWLGDKQFLLEVSGLQSGSIDGLCSEKAKQLLGNPFDKPGYVCVATYDSRKARLWFYEQNESGG